MVVQSTRGLAGSCRPKGCSEMGDSPIRVSVIIATYNRADELMRLLESLRSSLARPDVELILVDDGSTDGTVERAMPLLEAPLARATVIRQENQGPGTARNKGILAAAGEIVVFVDTDCVVEPEWLDALTAPFDDDKVGGVGGPDRSRPYRRRTAR
jgi:glycosyltransferase involved in cell wall biosynthesis